MPAQKVDGRYNQRGGIHWKIGRTEKEEEREKLPNLKQATLKYFSLDKNWTHTQTTIVCELLCRISLRELWTAKSLWNNYCCLMKRGQWFAYCIQIILDVFITLLDLLSAEHKQLFFCYGSFLSLQSLSKCRLYSTPICNPSSSVIDL